MRRLQRDERGLVEFGAGLIVLAGIAAIPVIILGLVDLHSYYTGKWDKKEQKTGVVAARIPFLGPRLPPEGDSRRACYLNRAGSLQWTAGGWRHPAYPEPEFSRDPAVYRGRVEVWTETMVSLIRDANFGECDAPPPSLPPVSQVVPEDPNVSGSYQVALAYQGGPPAQCATEGVSGIPLRVGQPGKGRITLTFTGTPRVQQGGLTDSLSFEARNEAGDTVRGQFTGPPERLRIESGYVALVPTDGDTPCAYTFSGERVGR